ncbi:hypothetical protein PPYR_01956 [Photinus pyralis]|uniref:UDP-glucuronosyltransferase n=1 Tax=Photinus pyralis TaxID=7054 RepID=A0A5N4B5Z9_PHOPY|nr:UDP-glucuronosyltransferase 2B1-like [Photinus pyralis]KAB0804986.1 hypothetical protein PPYR_01956 [Photinus pyralis]
MNFLIVFVLLSVVCGAFCAKILAVFHFPCKSHHILGSALLKELARKGHEVTMISPFPFQHPVTNYRDVDITGMLDYKEKYIVPKFVNAHEASMYDKMTFSIKNAKEVAELFLNHPNYKKILSEHFDLVILNWSMNEAFLGIAHHFKAPVIVFSTIGSSQLTNKITRNPAPYSYVRNIFATYPDHMNFLQRMSNAFWSVTFTLVDNFVNEKVQQELLTKYFPNAPPLQTLIDNVSLVLLNSHFAIEGARPYVPNMIEIGGFHVEKPKPLSADLKKFLDDASEGAIFFSLGTNVKSSHLPKEKLDEIVKCFAKLKLKVVWKFEKRSLQLPSNVYADEWLPQTDILAHPNVKAFVTHGGRLSTIEALHYGVPVIGIPFFSDQEYNIADCVNKGYGVRLNYKELTADTLNHALLEVAGNPTYSRNAKLRSDILHDQPLPPLDIATYWVEYIIRHDGAFHLQCASVRLTWYQRILLDVTAFILLIITSFLFALYFVIRTVYRSLRALFSKSSKKRDLKKKKK